MGNPVNIKRLTINLEDYILEIAEEKSKIMFKGKIEDYIHWLICSNNKYEVKKKIKEIEKSISISVFILENIVCIDMLIKGNKLNL